MKYLKEVYNDFKVVPFKKFMTLLFFFTCILGYVIMATFPYFASQIIKYATIGNTLAYTYTFYLAVAYILYEIIWYFNYYIYSFLQTYYSNIIHKKLFNKICTSSRKISKTLDNGKMLSLVGDDIPSFCYLLDSITVYISTIFMIILTIILILKAHFIFAIITVISLIIYIMFMTKNMDKYSKYLKEQKKHNDTINSIYVEELNALKEIKTLPIKDNLYKKLQTKLNRYTKAYFKKRRYFVRNKNTSTLIPQYTKFILYLFLLIFMVKFNATIDLVILIIGYYDQLIENLTELVGSYREIKEYHISVKRVNEALTYEDDLSNLFGKYENDEIYGSIVFKNVSYKYNSKYILDNINLEIKPNTLNVFIGPSGSGKTTLLDLLLRFYKVNSGEIYLDSVNIYEYSDSIYASNITLVKQNPFIYNMSIRDNLRLVNSNKKRQEEAIKEVGLHEYIMSLPKGYSTVLTGNASNLSGGQKQLLSIARSLLTDAEILLMDDITASLDPKTTNEIIDLLVRLKEDHTILVITNREDIINRADKIFYLNNGKVKSYKSLEELKEKLDSESEVLI